MNKPHRSVVSAVSSVEQKLGYVFHDKRLVEKALTHRSLAAGSGTLGGHNERLEFLGDSVLGLAISALLMQRQPGWDEGTLSRARSYLVKRETLVRQAKRLSLGYIVLIGKGEEKNQGRQKESILANAYEALLGALFLDAGFDTTCQVITRLFEQEMHRAILLPTHEDAKTILQKVVQERWGILPVYETSESVDEQEKRFFEAIVKIHEKPMGNGHGSSKRRAQQEAAAAALAALSEAKQGSLGDVVG